MCNSKQMCNAGVITCHSKEPLARRLLPEFISMTRPILHLCVCLLLCKLLTGLSAAPPPVTVFDEQVCIAPAIPLLLIVSTYMYDHSILGDADAIREDGAVSVNCRGPAARFTPVGA